ncbi:MAG: glycosyltransferase family 2 protein [Pseudoruegeria sp.]
MQDWWTAYRLRWRRRKYLLRALRKSRELTCLHDVTSDIRCDDILLFSTVRNEMERLPHFLEFYRKRGINQFLIVDNASDDGTTEFLQQQPDVSLWGTECSYRKSRFGVDWLNGLQSRYGSGHWCLTADADELLVIPTDASQNIRHLIADLEQDAHKTFSALMLDCYPKGAVSKAEVLAGGDPMDVVGWFDAEGYTWELQDKFQNISIRGGPRMRMFFAGAPEKAPHLHKTPLVKWRKGYAYASSTHLLLPRTLNAGFDARRDAPTGVFLHTKFQNTIVDKSTKERLRAEHFTHPDAYASYYDSIASDPDFWTTDSQKFSDYEQLIHLGLMTRGIRR